MGQTMSIVYLFASLLGALATASALWLNGWPVAILCAPLGGSALTLAVAVAAGLLRTGPGVTRPTDVIPI
jgi:hypothetical protein